jgi:hypothetical protein
MQQGAQVVHFLYWKRLVRQISTTNGLLTVVDGYATIRAIGRDKVVAFDALHSPLTHSMCAANQCCTRDRYAASMDIAAPYSPHPQLNTQVDHTPSHTFRSRN